MASASYQALFKSNRETYLRDRDAIGMSSLDEIIQSRKNLELAKMKEGQTTKLSKTTPAIALGRGLLKTKELFDGVALKKEKDFFDYQNRIGVSRGGDFDTMQSYAKKQSSTAMRTSNIALKGLKCPRKKVLL